MVILVIGEDPYGLYLFSSMDFATMRYRDGVVGMGICEGSGLNGISDVTIEHPNTANAGFVGNTDGTVGIIGCSCYLSSTTSTYKNGK